MLLVYAFNAESLVKEIGKIKDFMEYKMLILKN